jgi:hypothetical protein
MRSDAIIPIWRIRGVFMSKFNKLAKLTAGTQYSIPMIIAGQSECFFNNDVQSSLSSCTKLSAMISKTYQFDNMIKKLYDVAAIKLLENNTPILWSNDHSKLASDKHLCKSYDGKRLDCNAIKGAVISEANTKFVYKVVFSFYPIPTIDGEISLDSIYTTIPHELAHFVFNDFSKPLNQLGMVPYRNEEQKGRFVTKSVEVLQNILNVRAEYELQDNFETLRKRFCKEFNVHKSDLFSKAKAASKREELIKTVIKLTEISTIEPAICSTHLEALQHSELAVRHFEQIINGIDSNNGVHSQDLIYLQPMVEYTKEVLYPEFDKYISERCNESKTYKCFFDTNNELSKIALVEPAIINLEL